MAQQDNRLPEDGNDPQNLSRVPSANNRYNSNSRIPTPIRAVGNMIGRGVTKAVTGKEPGALKALSRGGKIKAFTGHIGKGILRGAGMAALGTAGLIVGAGTAIATGDAKNIATGVTTGVMAGNRIGAGLSSGIGGLASSYIQARGDIDENYKNAVMADQAKEAFFEKNGYVPDERQSNMIDMFAGHTDLSDGDEKKIDDLADGYDYYVKTVGLSASEAAAATYADYKARSNYDLYTPTGKEQYVKDNKEAIEALADSQLNAATVNDGNGGKISPIQKITNDVNAMAPADIRSEINTHYEKQKKQEEEAIRAEYKKKLEDMRADGAERPELRAIAQERERKIRDNNTRLDNESMSVSVDSYRQEKINQLIAAQRQAIINSHVDKVKGAKYK